MRQVQTQNLDELLETILEDMSEEDKKATLEYAESIKEKGANELVRDIDTYNFTIDATLITRYISELFNGTYTKSYLEIEKLLNELPLDKCFFYDSKLLEEFNKCVYLFVLFEAANNRFELLNNRNIADIVSKEAYNKIININRSEDKYIPFDLYMAIKELSDNRSKDMFLSKELLIRLYYYELNINHVSKVSVRNVEGEVLSETSNLNVYNQSLDTLKKPLKIKQAIMVVSTTLSLFGSVLGGKKLYNSDIWLPKTTMTTETGSEIDDKKSHIRSSTTDEGIYIMEYTKLENNKLLIKEYKISDDTEDKKYSDKLMHDDLYDIELTEDMLVSSKKVDIDDIKEHNKEPYYETKQFYLKNQPYYRTVTINNSSKPSEVLGTVEFSTLCFFGCLVLLMLLDAGLSKAFVDVIEEYNKTKTLSDESLEKLKGLLMKLRNTVLINNPGTLNLETLEEHNFRI